MGILYLTKGLVKTHFDLQTFLSGAYECYIPKRECQRPESYQLITALCPLTLEWETIILKLSKLYELLVINLGISSSEMTITFYHQNGSNRLLSGLDYNSHGRTLNGHINSRLRNKRKKEAEVNFAGALLQYHLPRFLKKFIWPRTGFSMSCSKVLASSLLSACLAETIPSYFD